MNVAIDSGNTFAKIGWFDEDKLIRFETRLIWSEMIREIQNDVPERIIFSSVNNSFEELIKALNLNVPVLNLSAETPIPIKKNIKLPKH